MATFPFELVSPERVLFSGAVTAVVVPAADGELTVMAGHAPFMAALKPGFVTVTEGSVTRRLFVRGGFADVAETGLTLLADGATPAEEMTPAALDAEIAAADADAAKEATAGPAAERLARLRELRGTMAA